jgi:hypothetical protein
MFSTISVHENVDALWISAYSRLYSAGCECCAISAQCTVAVKIKSVRPELVEG